MVASVRIAADHALPTSRGQPSGGKTSARKWFGRLYQPALLDRRLDERREQRMRREWTRFQLGVELHGDEPGMLFVFNDLRQDTVGGHPREAHAPLLEPALVIRVHFITMAVALGNLGRSVDLSDLASWLEPCRISAEPHRAAEIAVGPALLQCIAAQPLRPLPDPGRRSRAELG